MSYTQIGLLLGFLGALLNASNYALSKDCLEKYGLRGLRQLAATHVGMALLALPLFVCGGYCLKITPALAGDMLLLNAPYLAAQFLLLKLLERTDASVVSPLLTLKLPVVALAGLIFAGQEYSARQVAAIVLILALSFYFSSLSGRIRLKPLLVILVISAGYVGADYATVNFMRHYPGSDLEKGLACVSWQYVMIGPLALAAFCVRRVRITPRDVLSAKWTSLSWIGGSFCMVGCFYLAGVVEGNIVQSLRCILGVLIAYFFFREYVSGRHSFTRKLLIAVGMFAAVIAYHT